LSLVRVSVVVIVVVVAFLLLLLFRVLRAFCLLDFTSFSATSPRNGN